ncbi:MAG TPA: thiol:disulfide interchange protein DsbA/DsbL [Burkholderiaceae bacterium]|nr:thiol:disulfide interchange protein DsbA/DsbL [Burkholderiaceae bacterium]
MKRRQFAIAAASTTAALGAGLYTLTSANSVAQPVVGKAGSDYMVLDKAAPYEPVAGKVEVVEFFGYWCPHCNAFEPELETWLKRLPSNVSFKRIPVAFNSVHEPLQKLYYALESLGRVSDMQRKVFTAIHADKINLNTQDAIVAWAVKQGLDQKKFVDAYTSFSVNAKVAKAKQLVNTFKIDGVPSLGVAGKYYVDGTLAKGMTRALQIVEQLTKDAKPA